MTAEIKTELNPEICPRCNCNEIVHTIWSKRDSALILGCTCKDCHYFFMSEYKINERIWSEYKGDINEKP